MVAVGGGFSDLFGPGAGVTTTLETPRDFSRPFAWSGTIQVTGTDVWQVTGLFRGDSARLSSVSVNAKVAGFLTGAAPGDRLQLVGVTVGVGDLWLACTSGVCAAASPTTITVPVGQKLVVQSSFNIQASTISYVSLRLE